MSSGPTADAPASEPTETPTATAAVDPVVEPDANKPEAAAGTIKPTGNKASRRAPLPRLGGGPLAARGLGVAKPASPSASSSKAPVRPGQPTKTDHSEPEDEPQRPVAEAASTDTSHLEETPEKPQKGKGAKDADYAPVPKPRTTKVAIPSLRRKDDDLESQLEATLAGSDVSEFLAGSAGLPDRREPLEEGVKIAARVIKHDGEHIFLSLGGPDEGLLPIEQLRRAAEVSEIRQQKAAEQEKLQAAFARLESGDDAEDQTVADETVPSMTTLTPPAELQIPAAGETMEVTVRGFNREDGLYVCSLPDAAIEVNDWDDIEDGSVVEATITAANTGGLECKVGGVRGFIPMSQISEYRVEDASEYVDQKLVCVVTEANARRGNLVLSRRAILEREREAKAKEQLEKMEVGDVMTGIVRKVLDFGVFVDLGGVDGLIHVSKLSWERIKHPSEVISEGQQVKVKVESVDKEKKKIGLSYRDLLENPWDKAEAEFAEGSVHRGVVTKTAEFGCFVRLAAGVEGLVHISELASHRVSMVSAFVQVGDEVEVKILSFDRQSQKVSLSIKQAQSIGEPVIQKEEEDEPQREVAIKPQHAGPLKGGTTRDSGGEKFGLRW